MNVVIDRGNTRTKLALFDADNQMVDVFKYDNKGLNLEDEIKKHHAEKLIFCSVTQDVNIDTKGFVCLNHRTPLPIKSDYKSATVGVDRLALAVGVNTVSPNTNCLFFDFGSAITIDFISANNVFMGGNISPGLSMRFASLHEKTGRLPLMNEKQWQYHLWADNTEDAICAGVVQSIIFEIEGYIARYEKKYPDLKIFFTGGDAIFFAKQIKKSIFANENLVLIGLNRILNYNV